MKSVIEILDNKIVAAMKAVSDSDDCNAIITPATDAKFGDYQANGIMALAKQLKTNPRQLAEKVVQELDLSDICEKIEIAGPGFINLSLKNNFIADSLLQIKNDPENLGIDKIQKPKTIVVDFSGPNIAKQMHVGHLRSTIIGDCICRMLEFLGHNIIPQNHIGDWGTQFGMLIQLLYEEFPALKQEYAKLENPIQAIENIHIKDLETYYKEAKRRYDDDENFNAKARRRVVELHNHDKQTMKAWQQIVDESRNHYQPIYETLSVELYLKNEKGESFYSDKLSKVVEKLQKDGLAKPSDGAVCVFPEGFKNKEGNRLPLIVQKSDGAYLYATTDLAAIQYRVNELKADTIIYVTDARQGLHFEMVFAVAKKAGLAKDNVSLNHVAFGTMLGEDNRPFKTRSGENVKLKDLLAEAVERARTVVEEKNPDLPDDEKTRIAQAVGIGAVKYADYSNNRTSDYIFSFDKMLAMDGNTAPYMQYAYARIKSIERKAGQDIETELAGIKDLNLAEPAELDLAKHLIRYGEAIKGAAENYMPNYLTTYLYDLAQKFSSFYNACPVLKAGADKRPTRLLLCDLTAKTIEHGLSQLLGINVVKQM